MVNFAAAVTKLWAVSRQFGLGQVLPRVAGPVVVLHLRVAGRALSGGLLPARTLSGYIGRPATAVIKVQSP